VSPPALLDQTCSKAEDFFTSKKAELGRKRKRSIPEDEESDGEQASRADADADSSLVLTTGRLDEFGWKHRD